MTVLRSGPVDGGEMQEDRVTRPSVPPDGQKTPLLRVEHVKISYRTRKETVAAVADATFTMEEHERLIVIGPSGCGKSTLLKAVGGFLKPNGGRIEFKGRTDLTPSPDRAAVFQEFDQLFPWRTVLENVAYPLRVIGHERSSAREQARRYLEMTGLTQAATRHPHELSGGMKQRVAIARALALEPAMLLMDEPFGSLDAITRARLQGELQRIAAQTSVAYFFVTHSIQEALTLGDRIVVLGQPPSTVVEIVDVRNVNQPTDPNYVEIQMHLHELLGATDEDLSGVAG